MPTIDDLSQAILIQMQIADVEMIRANSKELISQLLEVNEDVFEHLFLLCMSSLPLCQMPTYKGSIRI